MRRSAIFLLAVLVFGSAGLACGPLKCPKGYAPAGDKCRALPDAGRDAGVESSDFDAALDSAAGFEFEAGAPEPDAPSCSHGCRPNCSVNNGGCEQVCVDAPDGPRCSCRAGARLSADGVSCRTPAWSTPVLVEMDNTGDVTGASVAMDGEGRAFAAWPQDNGTIYSQCVNRYLPGTGWEEPRRLEVPKSAYPGARLSFVASNRAGDAMAVWDQAAEDRIHDAWSSRFTPEKGWSSPTLLEREPGMVLGVRVGVDAAGGAVAVWSASGNTSDLWSARYVVDTGWEPAVLVEKLDQGSVSDPRVAVDLLGNAFAVWAQRDGAKSDIWANRSVVGSGWGTPTLLETDDGYAQTPEVAVDHDGNALVVWSQKEGARLAIWSNRFVVGKGWAGSERAAHDETIDLVTPRVAFDRRGNAMAIWGRMQQQSTQVEAAMYRTGQGWQQPTIVSAANAPDRDLAMDLDSGESIVVWTQLDGNRYDLWSRRYVPGDGWEDPTPLREGPADERNPLIAMAAGIATVIWFESDGTHTNLWSSRFE